MGASQVAPTIQTATQLMTLVQRKNGPGIFWSCSNCRTKGCKGYNVDEVDIDGTIAW